MTCVSLVAFSTPRDYGRAMRLLVHSATGPENPTRAALALLVARTATEEGHEVRVFLAGDAVHLARDLTAAAVAGVGTGAVAEHLGALRGAGVEVHLSGQSSKARGVEAPDGMRLSPPASLVEFTDWADKVLTY
jgi:predicted peroxiredoxin